MPTRALIEKSVELHHWLFNTGTRVVEVINTIFLIGFMSVFLHDFNGLSALPSYRAFAIASNEWWWLSMGILGLLQFIAMVKKTNASNQMSGFILLISAWIWIVVAGTFIISTPPLSTAPIMYTTIAILCALAGLYLLKFNKAKEGADKKSKVAQE